MATGEVMDEAPGDPSGASAASLPPGRLGGVDATRGLALLGMMSVHVLPTLDPDGSASTAQLIAGGRSAATFAVLAGVGLALSTGGPRPPGRRSWGEHALTILVRAVAIGSIGLGLGYPEARVVVILPYYALLFLFALPLLRRGARPLALLCVGAAVLVPPMSFLLRAELEPWVFANPTFRTLVDEPGELLVTLLLTGEYPVLAWTTYLFAGMAMGRLPLRSARLAAGLLVVGAAVALGATALSELLLGPLGGLDRLAEVAGSPGGAAGLEVALEANKSGNVSTDSWWWLVVDSPHSSTPLDLLHTTGFAVALLGALLLVSRTRAGLWLTAPLAAAGSMTLTLYTGHVLLLSTQWLPDDPMTSYRYQVLGVLVFAVGWRALFGRGPIEAVIAVLASRASRAAARSEGPSAP